MRAAKLIIILGFNGTGKTTLLKKIVSNEIKKKDSKVLIVTPDDAEWNEYPYNYIQNANQLNFEGANRTIYNEYDTLQKIQAFYRKGMLIFDDCRSYLRSNTEMSIHNLLIRRRQKMIDIIAVGHGFTEVPPKFFTFASEIILFQTKDNIGKRKYVIRDFSRMELAQKTVNQKALTDKHYFEIIKQ